LADNKPCAADAPHGVACEHGAHSLLGGKMAKTDGAFDRTATNVNIVYYLYLASVLVGITAIVGVIMAYMNRGPGSDWLDSHYTYQIRTFWIGLLYSVIGLVLTFIIIGFLVLLFVLIWWIVRSIKGLQLAGARQPVPDPATWMW
jgi:uncharacterized membrane protein